MTAQECLTLELEEKERLVKNGKIELVRSGWLKKETVGDHKMDEQEFQEYQKAKK